MLRVSSEKLMARPPVFPLRSECTSGCWASDRLTPAILGRGPATCSAPGNVIWGLDILDGNAGGQQLATMRRGLKLDRGFALLQIVRSRLHGGKFPRRIRSVMTRDPFESRPPQNHRLLGFAQVGAQGQTIEGGIREGESPAERRAMDPFAWVRIKR